jgi:isopropylmalate/homocitrate/citramalate synthase
MIKELTRYEIQTIYKCGRIITEYVLAKDRDEMLEKYMKHHDMSKIDGFSVIGIKSHIKKTDKIYGKKVIN